MCAGVLFGAQYFRRSFQGQSASMLVYRLRRRSRNMVQQPSWQRRLPFPLSRRLEMLGYDEGDQWIEA